MAYDFCGAGQQGEKLFRAPEPPPAELPPRRFGVDPALDAASGTFEQIMMETYQTVEMALGHVYEQYLEQNGAPPEGWQDRPDVSFEGGVQNETTRVRIMIRREPISETRRLRIDAYRQEIARLEGLLAVALADRFAR